LEVIYRAQFTSIEYNGYFAQLPKGAAGQVFIDTKKDDFDEMTTNAVIVNSSI